MIKSYSKIKEELEELVNKDNNHMYKSYIALLKFGRFNIELIASKMFLEAVFPLIQKSSKCHEKTKFMLKRAEDIFSVIEEGKKPEEEFSLDYISSIITYSSTFSKWELPKLKVY
ncbi:MAG: hypothetical protein PHW96_03085 [Candidatus Nanoarchaeia archaeon]|nr:hypothetical protein [Candidatus Nanoarchaeia archaeon]